MMEKWVLSFLLCSMWFKTLFFLHWYWYPILRDFHLLQLLLELVGNKPWVLQWHPGSFILVVVAYLQLQSPFSECVCNFWICVRKCIYVLYPLDFNACLKQPSIALSRFFFLFSKRPAWTLDFRLKSCFIAKEALQWKLWTWRICCVCFIKLLIMMSAFVLKIGSVL